MNKKIMALLLALCMILSIAPVTLLAAEAPEAKWGASASSLTQSGKFTDAIAALSSASGNTYIQLQKDVVLTAELTIRCPNGDLTIDLNGYDISAPNLTKAFYFRENSEKTFTITDTYKGSDRESVVSAGASGYGVIMIRSTAAHVVIEAGKFSGPTYAVYGYLSSGRTGTLTIKGGTFESTGARATVAMNDGETIIEGGKFVTSAAYQLSIQSAACSDRFDLSGHKDPGGITFQVTAAMPVTNIALPTDYALFDANDNLIDLNNQTASLANGTYVIKFIGVEDENDELFAFPISPDAPIIPVVIDASYAPGSSIATIYSPVPYATIAPAAPALSGVLIQTIIPRAIKAPNTYFG